MKLKVREIFYYVSQQALSFDEHTSVVDYNTACETTLKLLTELEKAVREEERERILNGINEFSHCKKWELDETTDFYLDASIEQIKDLIIPPKRVEK